ncbi:MAG: hypothetical protein EPN30_03710 [Actinomycetota bacterium]|nr:MAG: hypothetical protein EPN30_03710 [Actinomycetota bacterium]
MDIMKTDAGKNTAYGRLHSRFARCQDRRQDRIKDLEDDIGDLEEDLAKKKAALLNCGSLYKRGSKNLGMAELA